MVQWLLNITRLPLSGGDRKALKKESVKSRAMAGILAQQARAEGEEEMIVEITTRMVLWAAASIFAVYFPIAWWLKTSYVPREEPPGAVMLLNRPYNKLDDNGIAFVAHASRLGDMADSSDGPRRSPVILYENEKPLGPPHSAHSDISKFGLGRFSHWNTARGFIFSSSDNSDPNFNGRNYWAILPTESIPR